LAGSIQPKLKLKEIIFVAGVVTDRAEGLKSNTSAVLRMC